MKINVEYTETKQIGEKMMLISDELEEIRNKLNNQIDGIKSAWMEIDSEITLGSMSNYVNSTLYNTIVGVKEYGNCIVKKSNMYDSVHGDYKIKARKTLVESDSLSNNLANNMKNSQLEVDNQWQL